MKRIRFRDMPISIKIMIINLTACAVCLGVACGAFLVYDQIAFRRDTENSTHALARVMADNSTAAIAFDDQETATRVLEALEREPEILLATLYDRRMKPLASFHKAGWEGHKPPDVLLDAGTVYDQGRMCVFAPVILDGERIGTLHISHSMRDARLRFVRTVVVLAAILALSAILAWVLVWRMQSRISKPIRALTDVAEHVARERDYTRRASGGSRDEIGTLVGVFNTMLDRLEERDVAVRDYQSKLRSMASQILLTEERERRRISTGLHDSICQYLWVASMRLKRLNDNETIDPDESRQILRDVLLMLDDSMKEVRSFMFQLSPPSLYDLGLGAALVSLSREAEQRYGLDVQVRGQDVAIAHNEELNVFLYRAANEALKNVYKYAETGKAEIQVELEDHLVRLTVSDDGAGFDPEALDTRDFTTGGFGLFSIRERARNFHGRLEVTSKPGRGTTIALEIPLQSDG